MNKEDERDKGFKVPTGYFDHLEDRVVSRLSKESRKGFKVPEGYFEDFDVNPNMAIDDRRAIALDRRGRARILWMAAAASVMLFFGVKYMNTEQNSLEWKNLDDREISSWIESDLTELNAYDIAEAYQEVELEVSVPANSELDEYLNEIDLNQILIEN